MAERMIVIGGVAAGTSAAVKIRRASEDAEIVLYEKGKHISYGSCGLPYYISGTINDIGSLVINTPLSFKQRFNIEVKVRCQVTKIDPESKTIEVQDLKNGRVFSDRWDKLVIATGSKPVKLSLQGADAENVFVLKTIDDGIKLKRYLDRLEGRDLRAVVIGGGFVGLELLEAFIRKGMKVTILEKENQLLPLFDAQITEYLSNYLKDEGIEIRYGHDASKLITRNGKVEWIQIKNGEKIKADLVFFGIGSRPNGELAKNAGINVGKNGGIEVDKYLHTNINDIYAAGDCCQCTNEITGLRKPYNLASIANRQGRTAGYNVCGGSDVFDASSVASLIKVLDVTLAKTGIGLKEAQQAGIDTGIIELHHLTHAHYYPGAKMVHMLLVYRKENGKILGLQAISKKGAGKRADIVSTAIKAGMSVEDLAGLDLCYHPEFGTAKDAINMLGMVGDNMKKKEIDFIECSALKKLLDQGSDFTLLDVRSKQEYDENRIEGAVHIHVDDLRDHMGKLDKKKMIIIYCKTGYRAYLAYRILRQNNFQDVKLLNGSMTSWLRKL